MSEPSVACIACGEPQTLRRDSVNPLETERRTFRFERCINHPPYNLAALIICEGCYLTDAVYLYPHPVTVADLVAFRVQQAERRNRVHMSDYQESFLAERFARLD